MNDLPVDLAGPKKARVEIIPLIDVIFFLLATFVLFTLSLHRLKMFDPDLPKVDGKPEPIDVTTAFIQASADGTFYWKVGTLGMPETITAQELALRLADYKRTVAIPRVFVRSDGRARLRDAVLVLDEVRKAGIKQVAIETIASKTGS